MWKGRVWTERSALSDCCDDGPLSSLILRLNGCLIPPSSGRRCMGGVLGPLPWIFRKSKVEGRGPHLQGGVFQRDADMTSGARGGAHH